MAIAEMSRMVAVCLSFEKDALLSAFVKTGAVELCATREYQATLPMAVESSEPLTDYKERLERALLFLEEAKTALPKGEAKKSAPITLSVEEFLSLQKKAAEVEETLRQTEEITERKLAIKAEKAAARADQRAYAPYRSLPMPFAAYADTRSTVITVGVADGDKVDGLTAGLSAVGAEWKAYPSEGGKTLLVIAAVKEDKAEVEELLFAAGFTRCPFTQNERAEDKIAAAIEVERVASEEEQALLTQATHFLPQENALKAQLDYVEFVLEKGKAEERFRATENSLVIEGYVPTQAVEEVRAAAEGVTSALHLEFSVVPRTEFAPTLMQNKKTTQNFEAVTNMYSVPAYGALDPNGAMSIFFTLFMGLLMADVGYGILMLLGGFWFAGRQQQGSTVQRMAKVFAYGGAFAVLFGALFDSFFGYGLLRATCGSGYNAFYAKYLDAIVAQASVAGITVPSILLWCLGLGTLHLAFGLLLKAAQCFGRKQYLEGVFGGIVWALALVSLTLWVFGMVSGTEPLKTYGAYVTAGLFILGVLTAGIAEKGLGKVVKVFSSAYGIINYASDILSYARLYGLMLSGAQIASIFTNTLAIGLLFPKGPVGIAFGVILIIVGNLFNLAMNLLGAFIHNSRLQYVEFFGKFYEGEGELFAPLGQTRRFVRLQR